MQNKLTLRLDDALIKQAKIYAKENDKSLSQIVADYFQSLTKDTANAKLPPITNSLIGIAEDVSEHDYKQHLEEKHL